MTGISAFSTTMLSGVGIGQPTLHIKLVPRHFRGGGGAGTSREGQQIPKNMVVREKGVVAPQQVGFFRCFFFIWRLVIFS